MSWQDKSERCSLKDFDDFQRELEAVRSSKNKSEQALIRRLQFEQQWIGLCLDCRRVIPNTKQYCPWCKQNF